MSTDGGVSKARGESDWSRQIIEAIPSAMAVIDVQGIVRMVNAEAESMFGYKRTELLGSSVDILLPARFRHVHPAHRASYFQAPTRRTMGIGRELYARRKDDTEFAVEIGLSPIETEEGVMTLSVIADITERKRIAMRMHDSLALQAAIVASSDNAIVSMSPSGIITSWNPAAERMLGYASHEAIGKNIFSMSIIAEHAEEERSTIAQALADGQVKHLHTRRQNKNGVILDLAVTLSPLRNTQDVVVGLVMVKRDISAFRKQQAWFQAVVESMPAGVVVVNQSGRIEMINAHSEMIFGYTRQELVGQSVDLLLPERLRDAHPAHRAAYFAAPSSRAMGAGRNLLCRRKDGSEFPVEIGLSAIESDDGLAALAAVTDISERSRTERLIAEHRDELERSNRELSTFAYVASHDLKSPLRGIDQLASWVEEDLKEQDLDSIPAHMKMMQSRIRRMENLLDDLLAYSRVGRVEGSTCPTCVADLARGVFDMLAPPAGMELELAPDLPSFTTLITPFEQVLRNLFSNALKHHDKTTGRISLSCTRDSDAYFRFIVHDDGPGIPPEYHERVFGMFQTLRPRDEVEGSGMGLALVKKLVETYGGTVQIKSDGVRGCEFQFTWPVNIKRRGES